MASKGNTGRAGVVSLRGKEKYLQPLIDEQIIYNLVEKDSRNTNTFLEFVDRAVVKSNSLSDSVREKVALSICAQLTMLDIDTINDPEHEKEYMFFRRLLTDKLERLK